MNIRLVDPQVVQSLLGGLKEAAAQLESWGVVWKMRKGDGDGGRAGEVKDGGWGHWGSWAQDGAQWGKSPMPLVVVRLVETPSRRRRGRGQ